MIRNTLMAGAAIAALSAGSAQAQDSAAALEARIAALESRISVLTAEVETARSRQSVQDADISRLDQRTSTPPPPAPAAVPAPAPDGFRIGNNVLRIGGFVKADFIASQYSAGDPANGDPMREFYLPGAIPVGGADESTATDFSARQTRFWRVITSNWLSLRNSW